jgi:hypothetical protein
MERIYRKSPQSDTFATNFYKVFQTRIKPMPRARKKTARKRILWTSADVKFLRKSAGRQPVSQISRQLHRSEAAVRYKATMLKVSLAMKRR